MRAARRACALSRVVAEVQPLALLAPAPAMLADARVPRLVVLEHARKGRQLTPRRRIDAVDVAGHGRCDLLVREQDAPVRPARVDEYLVGLVAPRECQSHTPGELEPVG